LLFVSLSTESGNFWMHPGTSILAGIVRRSVLLFIVTVRVWLVTVLSVNSYVITTIQTVTSN